MEKNQNDITIEELHKELDLIQACITRMAQNSFMVKGWTLGVLAVLIALAAETIAIWILCLMSVIIVIIFWMLDAFYLKAEICYRFKFEWVIENRINSNRDFLYDLNPYNISTRKAGKPTPALLFVMLAKPYTLLLFYGVPLAIGIVVLVLDLCGVIN